MSEKRTKVGIVGCGHISDIYMQNLTGPFARIVELKACADLVPERMAQKADQYGILAMGTEDMLADPEIEIVLNLTIPKAHRDVNCRALEAGKHAYSEKPLAVNLKDGAETLALARNRGLRLGCAPDTFLGGAMQTCRKIIDDGLIGKPTSAMAFMGCHGHESWHSDPEFYYEPGAGPVLDMGPYYLTALVSLLGPVSRVAASTGKALEKRIITSEKKYGKRIPVQVPTHHAGVIDFANGAIATVVMSFDIWQSDTPCLEIHGTEGTLAVPDPNGFGGTIKLHRAGDDGWRDVEISDFVYTFGERGIGITDMALAAQEGRPHRVSGEMALHLLEVMLAFGEASDAGTALMMKTTCARPDPLPAALDADCVRSNLRCNTETAGRSE